MNENLATSAAPAYERVRPRETTSVGPKISKRGKFIDIGGKIRYPYGTEAVMMPARGSSADLKSNSHARPLSGVESRISESPKHGTFGNTWQSGNIG